MKRLAAHLLEVGQLAWPLALVQLNNNLTGAVDTALAGRVDHVTLAATGLGAAVFVAFAVMGTGAGLGADPLVAQAFGRDDASTARHVMRQGLLVALTLSLPLVLGGLWLGHNLVRLGVAPDVAHGAEAYLWGRLPAIPAHCLVVVLRSFLQAARRTRPVLISAVLMNLFNLVADWVLLFGDAGLVALHLPALGLPPCGTFGLGLSSGLASFVQLGILMLAFSHLHGSRSHSAPPASQPLVDLQVARQVASLGLPAGAQMLAEVGIFSLVSLLMGGMGAKTAAAHQAAIMLASLSFSICVGIGAATSVQVGRAVGRNDTASARLAGLAGLFWGAFAMSLSSAAMWLCPTLLLGLMTDDPEVIREASGLLVIAGVFQLVDGAQVVAGGALRGAGSTRFAFVANVVAHWGVGLPLALLLAYGFGHGPEGLWWGLTMGLVLVCIALCGHFWRLSSQPIAAMRLHPGRVR